VRFPDGTLRLNISDAYAGKYKSGLQESAGDFAAQKNPNGRIGQAVALNNKFEGYKAKDMIGIPWIPVFASAIPAGICTMTSFG